MKVCKNIEDLITKYLDGDMKSDEKIRFEQHIEECESCKQELNEIRAMVDLCGEIEEEELPEDFNIKLHDRLVIEKEIEDRNKKLIYKNKYFKMAVSIAALFLILILVKDVQFSKFSSMISNFTDKNNDIMSNSTKSDLNDDKDNKNLNTDKSDRKTDNNHEEKETTKVTDKENKSKDTETVTESHSPDATSTPALETTDESESIELPQSASKIVINTYSPGEAESVIKSILKNDNVVINDESSTSTIYLELHFKYKNREYYDFKDEIKENFNSNISISEENIDSDLMMIKALEEEIVYFNNVRNTFEEGFYDSLIEEKEKEINTIKNTTYYTNVEINILESN